MNFKEALFYTAVATSTFTPACKSSPSEISSTNSKSEKGEQGIQGLQGLAGGKGEQGQVGQQGIKGEKGDKGIQGDMGPKGEKGEQGTQGFNGDKGDSGQIGPQGTGGKPGAMGLPGIQGISGLKGDKGDTGQEGKQGSAGSQGTKGEKGDSGLKGEKGDGGPEGKPGVYEAKCQTFAINAMINGNVNQCLYRIPKTDYEKINGVGATGITWQQCLKVCAELDMEMIGIKSVILACIADPTFYDKDQEKHWTDNGTPFAAINPIDADGKGVKNICNSANSPSLSGFNAWTYNPGANGGYAFPGWGSNHAYQIGGYGPFGCLCNSKPR